ncbi:RNA-binding Raly-like protein isoform X2 [Protopterus annectens]|uniref:RNA-binding Raly-like protein isoform X2 n=1 Tax=Protopterus annectens TaxID=7888 RepID=UPI001CF9B58B|nr:RNA-binding Raly-like protein isoform X2 [Protopterus annectens]
MSTLFLSEQHSPESNINMADDPKSNRPRAGQKRLGTVRHGSNADLEYDFYRENFTDRLCDSPLLSPPTQAVIPVKRLQITQPTSRKVKSSCSSKGSAGARMKLKPDELQLIKTELTQIKTQIDGLLDNLDKMDQEQQQLQKRVPAESKNCNGRTEVTCELNSYSSGEFINSHNDYLIESGETATSSEEDYHTEDSDTERATSARPPPVTWTPVSCNGICLFSKTVQ